LDGQAKTLGGTGDAALFGYNPKIMQMAKIQAHGEDLSSFTNSSFDYLWFFERLQMPARKSPLVNFIASM
jgi:hypothetical protein